jgi:hypothetical protein
MGTRGFFPEGKAAEAWSTPLTSIYCQGQRMSRAIPPLPQYAFMAWCSVKAQGHFTFTKYISSRRGLQGCDVIWCAKDTKTLLPPSSPSVLHSVPVQMATWISTAVKTSNLANMYLVKKYMFYLKQFPVRSIFNQNNPLFYCFIKTDFACCSVVRTYTMSFLSQELSVKGTGRRTYVSNRKDIRTAEVWKLTKKAHVKCAYSFGLRKQNVRSYN